MLSNFLQIIVETKNIKAKLSNILVETDKLYQIHYVVKEITSAVLQMVLKKEVTTTMRNISYHQK